MWRDFFSSIGIGSVKIDTVVNEKTAAPGETISGQVFLKGGQADEPVEKIQILLYLQYEEVREDSDFSWHDKHIEEITINVNKAIKAGEKNTIPFFVSVPENGPKTDEKHKWFIRTKAFIGQAVDPEDEDEIIVK